MANRQKSGLKVAFNRLTAKAKSLKKEVRALYMAYRRPDVPWYAKLAAILVVGYALSPVDLIPDFIPVLGYLDDLILIPLGVALVIKLVPGNIMEECRLQAEGVFRDVKPQNWVAGALIILVWAAVSGLVAYKVYRVFDFIG
jgi:uncharacterized membrane protein YkvA (DUF1232 family)